MNIRSKVQRSRSHGHKVHNVAVRQPCCTFSLRCVVAQRDGLAWPRLVARRHKRAGLSLLKAIERSTSVIHSIECPAASSYYSIIGGVNSTRAICKYLSCARKLTIDSLVYPHESKTKKNNNKEIKIKNR